MGRHAVDLQSLVRVAVFAGWKSYHTFAKKVVVNRSAQTELAAWLAKEHEIFLPIQHTLQENNGPKTIDTVPLEYAGPQFLFQETGDDGAKERATVLPDVLVPPSQSLYNGYNFSPRWAKNDHRGARC